MKTIRIYFVDFWKTFDCCNNFFYKSLIDRYNVVIDPVNPEYVFFSCFSYKIYKYPDAIKIYFTGENNVPDFNLADYAMGFHFLSFGDRYLRFPLYLLYDNVWERLDSETNIVSSELFTNRAFCNFVYSNRNGADPFREFFFNELSKYKKIDSGGKINNNIGYLVPDKLDFISKYKFTIAFENSSLNGYTTEKIIEPMSVNSIPIYWGNPNVGLDFNEQSFIHVTDKYKINQVIEYIIHLDEDQDAYLYKLNQSWFVRKEEKKQMINLFNDFLDNIFQQDIEKARRVSSFGFNQRINREERRTVFFKTNFIFNKLCDFVEKVKL